MPRDYLLEYRKPVLDEMTALSQRHRNVVIWDPFSTLCPGSTCEVVANGRPLFFDADHLSAYGSRFLYPDFATFLGSHLADFVPLQPRVP